MLRQETVNAATKTCRKHYPMPQNVSLGLNELCVLHLPTQRAFRGACHDGCRPPGQKDSLGLQSRNPFDPSFDFLFQSLQLWERRSFQPLCCIQSIRCPHPVGEGRQHLSCSIYNPAVLFAPLHARTIEDAPFRWQRRLDVTSLTWCHVLYASKEPS